MSSRYVAAATLLAMVALSTGAASAHAATAKQRAEARRIVAPIERFDRATRVKAPALEQRGREWSAPVAPCLQDGYAKAASAPDPTLAASVLFYVATLDAAAAMADPLDAELAASQRSYRRMKLRDRVLRAGARAKAQELAHLRRLPDLDTCSITQRWATAGFSMLELRTVVPELPAQGVLGGTAAAAAVERATTRLTRLGVSPSRASDFQMFPLINVAGPALFGLPIPPLR